MEITLTLNLEKRTIEIKPNEILLHVLREKFGMKSAKSGCERGDCGSCTIIMDGQSVKSCLILAVEADGADILTLEGLSKDKPTKLQENFVRDNAFQCGFCAPGMVLTTVDLLNKNKNPDTDEIKEAISGNLCRCTGYSPIINSIEKTVAEGVLS